MSLCEVLKAKETKESFLINTPPVCALQMGTLVLWGTPDVSFAVPLWVIILAILLGLLVLAMLTLAMWKVHTHSPSHNILVAV